MATVLCYEHNRRMMVVLIKKIKIYCCYVALFWIYTIVLVPQTVAQDNSVQAAHSGTYLTPGRDGEGWLVEVLNDTTALIIWFTFTPVDSDTGVQAWFGGVGNIDGNRIVVDSANITNGGIFGSQFDPAEVVRNPWGSITFEFDGPNSGNMNFSGLPEYGADMRAFVRLSGIAGLPFGVPTAELPPPNSGQPGVSGNWVDPTHDGEGWFLQEVAPGILLMAWFTYNDVGQQVWVIGTGEFQNGVAVFDNIQTADGTDFGTAFNQDQVNRTPWGSMRIVFTDCNNATLTYQSDFPEFGQGQLQPRRLTSLQNLNCAFPAEPNITNASWRVTSNTGPALSSISAARLDDAIYVAGGFSTGFFSQDQLWRYQPSTNVWTRLQDMPDVRDLSSMVAFDGSLYLLGGFVTNLFDGAPMDNNWRYDPDTDQWTVLTPMPTGHAAGGAVVIGDFIYVAGGTSNTTINRYSPEQGQWEVLAVDDDFERNSCAVVAFQGEIWIMGGGGRERDSQPINNQVAIFDPITGNTRPGPIMTSPRSSFSAAVVGGQIVANGGQVFLPPILITSTEAYNPETDNWQTIASSPINVQAASGVEFGGDFYSMLGSTEMDAIANIGQAQVLELPPQ